MTSLISAPDRTRGDICPGAFKLHHATDGSIGRVRFPGGYVRPQQWADIARIATELGLIPENLSAPARAAYREYRRIQHHLRLDGIASNRVEREAHIHQIEAVRALWSAVFDA